MEDVQIRSCVRKDYKMILMATAERRTSTVTIPFQAPQNFCKKTEIGGERSEPYLVSTRAS